MKIPALNWFIFVREIPLKKVITLWFYIFLAFSKLIAIEPFPVAYQGRFLPAESYSTQRLYHLTHKIPSSNSEALDILWQLHFFGPQQLNDSPLLRIQYQTTKETLNLHSPQKLFSPQMLRKAFEDPETNLATLKHLISKHYNQTFLSPENRSGRTTLELKTLSPGLWVQWKDNTLFIIDSPTSFPWQHLRREMPLVVDHPLPTDISKNDVFIKEIERILGVLLELEKLNTLANDEHFNHSYTQLINRHTPKEIALQLEQQHPLAVRLDQAGELFKALPGKFQQGKWYSLHALHTKVYNVTNRQLELVPNFTPYPNSLFDTIRNLYFQLEKAILTNENDKVSELKNLLAASLMEGYRGLTGKKYSSAIEKELSYPSIGQLYAEAFYTRYPLTFFCIFTYALALIFFLFRRGSSTAIYVLLIAFTLHTLILALRCYILGRPPVTNMLETILYVPWVSVCISLILYITGGMIFTFPLIASAAASSVLLLLLQFNFYSSDLENVQAVLDSHYWLLIHVLMVVGSYGFFLLASLLGHIYLAGIAYYKHETSTLTLVAHTLLQILYAGVVLLIGGTLLGGVWAAQSWGRFWDWDPKESWAFISICIYLLWIHAYRFGKIQHLGLAIGSVLGFLAISFTWYGVNYILGTGLHSYGFGNGDTFFYYCYLFAEMIFLVGSVIGFLHLKAEI